MRNLASINLKFKIPLTEFSTQMQNVERRVAKASQKMRKFGQGLTLGVTAPLLALAAVGVRAWDQQEQAIAQVNAGLKATGNAVGFTSDQLQKMATDLQGVTLFGDEAVLKDVTAQLLTFTNIANEQFERTQKAALDLATRLDGDLKSASIQLGKALNDPVANLSALSRSGIQFSTDQKKVINSLVKTNQLAKAQTIILDELEKQYGGSAEAAAKAGLGPFKQLGNILGDLSEDFGAIIGEALLPFVQKIKEAAERFRDLSPETKKFIVILAGVAAAIGPLLALAGTVLPAIVAGFTLLAGPVGLIIAGLTAIGVIIYKNWRPIKQTLVDIANYFIDLYNESLLFRVSVDSIVLGFRNLWSIGKFVFSALGTIISNVGTRIKNTFVNVGKILKAALTFNGTALKEALIDVVTSTQDGFSVLLGGLNEDFKQLGVDLSANMQQSIEGAGTRAKIVLKDENVDASAIERKIAEAVVNGIRKPAAASTAINAAPSAGATSVGGFDALDPNSLQGFTAPVDEELIAFQSRLLDFNNEAGSILEGTVESFVSGFAEIGAAIIQGNAGLGDIFGLLLSTLGDVAIQIGKAAIGIGVAMKAVKLSFKNPLAAIAAGAALVLVGSLLKGLGSSFGGSKGGGAPALAKGGLAFGPTLALVGDNPRASIDPEVISPLSKLKEFISPNNGGVREVPYIASAEIAGDKLRLILNRADERKSRRS